MLRLRLIIPILLACFLTTSVWAQDVPAPAEPEPAAAEPAAAAAEPAPAAAPEAVPAAAAPSDERDAKNTIFAELLGPAILWSLNYERLVIDQLAVRLGFSYWSISASAGIGDDSTSASVSMLYIPLTVAFVGLYSGSHGLEVGGGATLIYASGTADGLGYSSSGSGMGAVGTLNVGYRIHPMDGGFNFRIGLSAFFGPGLGLDVTDPDAFGILPWGYLGLGYSF
ncbi:MAG: hypothetical protein RBU37_13760 [Myxococcota bacterium]|jgi:hypothetical protein|nr:hypothetical protein [Myxococcota bacterium]